MTTPCSTYALIPPKILGCFSDRSELTLRELAQAMGRSIKTLQKQRQAGLLPVHIKGAGLERRHYVCTLGDVAEFYKRTGEECQFSESKIPPTTSSISKSKAIDFTARQKSVMNVRPRKSRKRSALKLSDLSNKPSDLDANP
jgi:hypothetical protein